MEDAFRKVIEHVFSNWTALRLAVEHMGGPDSKKVEAQCLDYMTDYCIGGQDVAIDDIQDVLEDILDEEFDTICEDGSVYEVSVVLHRFLRLLKDGNLAQYELEYNSLPKSNQYLNKSQSAPVESAVVGTDETEGDVGSGSTTSPEPMEEDSEWTVVSRRKK